ncbi:PQQ-dependent sugar dehydrogenase [Halomontanus rarus]|uniref:PQQ-dependent sugar dehydrogenase n=1 Tax=Halomontanus rarus TaxID=3034020 RepID=UPI001A986BF8
MTGTNPLTRRRLLAATGLTAIGGVLGSTGVIGNLAPSEGYDPREPGWRPAEDPPTEASVTTTAAITDLEIPWDLEFAGEDVFLTERRGSVCRLDADELVTGQGLGLADGEVLFDEDLPYLEAVGEGGALGVTAHPSYPDPRQIFVYYTADDGDLHNRLIRYDLDADEVTTLFDDVPAGEIHQGGRLEFGPKGYLWVTIGDAVEEYNATGVEVSQDPGSRRGVVFRLTTDGEPAPDNPNIGPNADPRAYAYGFRNPQGLAFTPDGEAVLTEHGPDGRDEVHVLAPGSNYGWGIARGGPDDPDLESYTDHDEFAAPIVNTGPEEGEKTWDPLDTWAPSGAAFYTDDAVPEFRNRVLVAGLRSQTLFAVSLYPAGADVPTDPDATVHDADWLDGRYTAVVHELLEGEFGRLRHVEQGPNGELFLLTGNRQDWSPPGHPTETDDRVIRVDPA